MKKLFSNAAKSFTLLKRFNSEGLFEYKAKFYGMWFMHAGVAVLLILPPLIIKDFIDNGILKSDTRKVWFSAFVLLAIFIALAIVDFFRHYWGHIIAQKLTYKLRNNLYWHFQKLSFSFHDDTKVGELISRLIDDLNRGQEVLYHAPQIWIQNGVMILVTAGVLFYLNPPLAGICITIVAMIGIAAYFISRKMFGAERKVRKKKASLSARAEESLSGIRIVQSFVREMYEMDKFEQENKAHYFSRIKAVYWWSYLFPVSIVILAIAMTVAIGIGGSQAITNPEIMTVGTLTAFVMYLQRLMFPLITIFLINEQVIQFMTGVERYFKFLDIQPTIKDKPNPVNLSKAKGDVEFHDVWFGYEKESYVLKGINLKAAAKQTIALVGPSGTGKTTLTRLVPRFYEPKKGSVKIDGVDVRDLSIHSLRANIGIVMQDDYLFSDTLYNNIAYGRIGVKKEEVFEATRKSNVEQFIKNLPEGYQTDVGQRGVKVSQGQAQRISIARAIVKDPPILILDEATSSVDSETEALIQQALERIMQDKTCFMIAHRLSTIINADKICFLLNGKITEEGTHQQLMQLNGNYAKYYNLQIKKVNLDKDNQ
jgi:ATP-binding cassette subfamily B protein